MQSIATFLHKFNDKICPIYTLLLVTMQYPFLGANAQILYEMLREILLKLKVWAKTKKGFAYTNTPFLWKEHLEWEHFKLAKYDSPEHS